MAVPEQTPYIEHTGNGVTTSFALGFQCESKDHLIVLVDEVEPPIATWSLSGGNVVFTTAPAAGKKITLQRNTPFGRTTDYQSFNNSFRPQTVNGDFDRLWLKLQELGVADWLLKLYVDRLHQQQEEKINNLKDYVDDRDDELRSYLLEEIRKQGVALDQLDDYYNYLMQRLAQIAVDKGWEASFVVDASGKNQQEINDSLGYIVEFHKIEKFEKPSDNGDASLMFKRAFEYAASKPYNVFFSGQNGKTYTLKTTTSTDPAVANSKVILDLPGNVCFDGNGCTIKVNNGFGNYRFAFRQTTYSNGGYFQHFTFDENHTNNPKTTNEATLDRRSVFSMWGPSASIGSLSYERVIFKDVIGVHQITTSSYKKLSIKWCEVHSSALEAPFVDRTAFYCGGDAEVLNNKFISTGKNAVTCIELHNSNSTAMFNICNGFRYGCFVVPESTLPRYNPIYQNVTVKYNNFENCLSGVKLWTEGTVNILPMKNITVEHNNVILNGRLNTGAAVQATEYGIGTLPNWATSIDNLSVQHNTVRFVRNTDDISGSTQHAYSLFALVAGTKYTLTNSQIRFNKAYNPPLSGFNWEFVGTNHADSILSNIDFSNNETFNAGTASNGHGARFLNVRKWVNFTSKDNTAVDDRATPHTLSVTSVFGGFTDDNILSGFKSIKDKLKLEKVSTPYLHYRADKAFYIDGYVNAAIDTRIQLRGAAESILKDEATGYVYKKIDGASLEWATFADVLSKPVIGWSHYGSDYRIIQPTAAGASNYRAIQSGYLYKANWQASTAYSVGECVNANNRVYRCTIAGTSGSSMPTGSSTETDGTVIWQYVGAAGIIKAVGQKASGLTSASTPEQIVAALKNAELAI